MRFLYAGLLAASISGALLAQAPPEPTSTCVRNCGGPAPAAPAKPSGDAGRSRSRANESAKEFSIEEGIDYFKRGDWDNAVRSFEEALDRDPDDKDARDWLTRARGRQAAKSVAPFMLPAVRVTGIAYVMTADGSRLDGRNMAQVPIDNRAQVFVGPGSSLEITFDNGTVWTLGAGTSVVLDKLGYDPNAGGLTLRASRIVGYLHWVTATRLSSKRVTATFETEWVAMTGKGTDFEIQVDAGGSGYVKVYEGLVEYTNKKTSRSGTVRPGETFQF